MCIESEISRVLYKLNKPHESFWGKWLYESSGISGFIDEAGAEVLIGTISGADESSKASFTFRFQ